MSQSALPRGLRNCNPGNLRRTADRWQGLHPVQTDREFFRFESMAWGYRALIRTLQNYRRRHACRTVSDFISRWAPPAENNTGAYIRTVCRRMEVPSTFVPDVDDEQTMCLMAAAISRVENGVEPDMDEIREGWKRLF